MAARFRRMGKRCLRLRRENDAEFLCEIKDRHSLLSDKKYGYKEPEMHDFFKLLCQNNISFYNNN